MPELALSFAARMQHECVSDRGKSGTESSPDVWGENDRFLTRQLNLPTTSFRCLNSLDDMLKAMIPGMIGIDVPRRATCALLMCIRLLEKQ